MKDLSQNVRKILDTTKVPRRIPADYEIENTSYRVVKLIMGTAKLSHLWDNIKFNDLA